MRVSGRMLATVLKLLEKKIEPGMTTKNLADTARDELIKMGGQPAFLGYQGFPDVLCVSINHEVVHGIPSKERVIQDGDIVSMDFGVKYRGMITDAAISVIAGKNKNKDASRLLEKTKIALESGVNEIHDGVVVGNISSSIQNSLDRYGYGIVRDLVGHGVGHELHEPPNIPNYGHAGNGPHLKAGMTVAIEPMATLGSHKIYIADDGWTVLTVDGSLSAHFEHTVLVTPNGAEVLTAISDYA